MQRSKLFIPLRGSWPFPESTGGLVKDTAFPGSRALFFSPAAPLMLIVSAPAINLHVRHRKPAGSVCPIDSYAGVFAFT